MEELNLPSGKYSLIRKIKSDEKGNVYLAEHKTMGVKRIIKKAIGKGLLRNSLMREAYILGRLKHPFIPSVCDIEEKEEAFYMIEEYIEGQSLYDYIRENGIFEQRKGLKLGVSLAKIIDFLHSGNSFKVCHLDIQPKNIIIKDNRIYLIDFGNAICSGVDMGDTVMATKGFAPPEQYMSGFGKSTGQSMSADIYGFGAVLLYMLTGVYKTSYSHDEIQIFLKEKKISGHIQNILSNALNEKADYRQNTMDIICRQIEKALEEKDICQRAGQPYVISVAGINRGAGSTYAAVLLTALLKEKGIYAIYEENHSRDTVRQLAKAYNQIEYDKGCFIFENIIMKPKYDDNIRLNIECSVIVRDEGTVEECKETGMQLIIIAQADILGWAGLKAAVDRIGHNFDTYGKSVSVVFNRCDEEMYRKASALISCCDGYIPVSSSPFCAKLQSLKGMEDILERLLCELKKGGSTCEEKYKSDTHRRDSKHWNSFGKKR